MTAQQTPRLFLFYVGGNAGRSNIEVHDVQFAAVPRPEDAHGLLVEAWFGDKNKVHLDGYSIIEWADGHDVTLSREPSDGELRLFFVNAGGYTPDTLIERHEFGLFVARHAAEAKSRAMKVLLATLKPTQLHKDNLHAVDDCVLLERLNGLYVHLSENPNGAPARPAWQGYLPIGSPE